MWQIDGVAPEVSIGIACGTVNSDLFEVLKEADAAMYVAKHVADMPTPWPSPLWRGQLSPRSERSALS